MFDVYPLHYLDLRLFSCIFCLSPANTLVSTGIGLRVQSGDYFAARIDYGVPLVDLESEGNSLQEDGVYFSLEIKPF